LKAHILNDNLIIIDTNHELAIKSLKYRQSMVSKLAIQKKTTNFLMLVIGLIVGRES
jgi:FKBP-type peptidyl-prolyl cis-trans isomerase 2